MAQPSPIPLVRPMTIRFWLFLVVCAACATAAEPSFTITQTTTSGVYRINDTVTWTIVAHYLPALPADAITYQVQRNGLTAIATGTLDLTSGSASITASLDSPGTLLTTVTATVPGATKALKILAGAAFEPDKISASSPKPDDFDAFWTAKLALLATIPMNPVIESFLSDNPAVDYWHLNMDNINGRHIRGQLARPKKGEKFPAMLIVQWAGVYPLQKPWVIGPASQGWLTLNISAHDQPLQEPELFYQELAGAALKNYAAIGNDDRETSYFLRMFLACSRAVDYLAQRPDWDGTTLLVTGGSQGGLQSFAAAGLNPKVTAVIVDVPAGCDNTALLADRAIGWPYWVNNAKDEKRLAASRYFDAVNFATLVTCPALIAAGLLDTTARPTGICAAANNLSGIKEMIILPNAAHQGDHAPFAARAALWKTALMKGQPVPPAATP